MLDKKANAGKDKEIEEILQNIKDVDKITSAAPKKSGLDALDEMASKVEDKKQIKIIDLPH